MREVTGAKHGLDNRCSVKGLSGFGGGRRKEAEGVGVEAVELAVMAEALNNGLSSLEALVCVLVR